MVQVYQKMGMDLTELKRRMTNTQGKKKGNFYVDNRFMMSDFVFYELIHSKVPPTIQNR